MLSLALENVILPQKVVDSAFKIHLNDTHKKPDTNLSETFAVPECHASLVSPFHIASFGYFEPAIVDLSKSIVSERL